MYLGYITASNGEEARKIARMLVEERLAACANVIDPIHSVYWWKGEMEEGEEALVLLKAPRSRVKEILRRVKEVHSYETPAIVFFDIRDGSPEYLRWVRDETREREPF
jgi:periplasmic divalent cation tolerance protein